jgi:DNA-binding transcriptional ArsR family regulator
MAKKMDPKEIRSMMQSSAEGVSELVKAAAHSNRLQLMALLADGPKEFSYLIEKVGLSKTALSNHIERVLELGLVERVGRGEYALTDDGKELLGAIATFYEGSKVREVQAGKKVSEQFAKAYSKGENGEKLVSSEPVYQPCWISYLGAVTGVLKSLGKERDMIDVGGYTGYAFLTNVAKGMTCPSGPTATKAWDLFMPATSVLGFKTKVYIDHPCFPQSKPLSAEDHARASKLFKVVKGSIETDRPVVLWGLSVPEYGIVKGYKGDSYLVSTYRRLMGKPDDPIRFDALDSPGCLHAIMFREEMPAISEKDDKDSIKRAIRVADGARLTHKNYVAGPEAFEEWASVLEKGKKEALIYHGNSYVAACYSEGKGLAATFLSRLARRYKDRPQARHLLDASKEYETSEGLMKQFTKLFPFGFKGDMSIEKCRKGAELLRQVKPHEVAAIAHMEKAVEAWK